MGSSDCSVMCGGGRQTQTRVCQMKGAIYEYDRCPEASNERKVQCNTQICRKFFEWEQSIPYFLHTFILQSNISRTNDGEI